MGSATEIFSAIDTEALPAKAGLLLLTSIMLIVTVKSTVVVLSEFALYASKTSFCSIASPNRGETTEIVPSVSQVKASFPDTFLYDTSAFSPASGSVKSSLCRTVEAKSSNTSKEISLTLGGLSLQSPTVIATGTKLVRGETPASEAVTMRSYDALPKSRSIAPSTVITPLSEMANGVDSLMEYETAPLTPSSLSDANTETTVDDKAAHSTTSAA